MPCRTLYAIAIISEIYLWVIIVYYIKPTEYIRQLNIYGSNIALNRIYIYDRFHVTLHNK